MTGDGRRRPPAPVRRRWSGRAPRATRRAPRCCCSISATPASSPAILAGSRMSSGPRRCWTAMSHRAAADAYNSLGWNQFNVGQLSGGAHLVRPGADWARRLAEPFLMANVDGSEAEVAYYAGEWESAAQLAERHIDNPERFHSVTARNIRGRIVLADGDTATALADARDNVEFGRTAATMSSCAPGCRCWHWPAGLRRRDGRSRLGRTVPRRPGTKPEARRLRPWVRWRCCWPRWGGATASQRRRTFSTDAIRWRVADRGARRRTLRRGGEPVRRARRWATGRRS